MTTLLREAAQLVSAEYKMFGISARFMEYMEQLRAALAAEQPCYCDKNGIGEPGVSCGDCPTRDYKKAQANQPQPGWKPIKTAPAQQCIVCGKPLGSAGDIHTCSPQVDQ